MVSIIITAQSRKWHLNSTKPSTNSFTNKRMTARNSNIRGFIRGRFSSHKNQPCAVKLKGGKKVVVIAAVVGASAGLYSWAAPKMEAKIEEKRKEKESKMVHVIADLVACLCFNPYAVLDLDTESAYETLRRSYVAELNKVHPDRVIGLSAEEQTLAFQRMKKLRIAWEIIQNDKGIHPLF